MNIIFRVDASLKIGTGHVMRCLALAKIFKENGLVVKFACRKLKGNLIKKICLDGFKVYELEGEFKGKVTKRLKHSDWLEVSDQQDADECIDIFNSEIFDWLIVDHYALDECWQKSLKPCYKKLLVIDDLADRKHQCDILIDQTFGRKKDDYLELVPKNCKMLLGSKYALLRHEFSSWRPYSLKRRIKPKFNQLLINMGGADVDNATEDILDELKLCNLPKDISIIVIMGEISPHVEFVKLKAKEIPYMVEVKVNVENMAEIMANSDIAIGAAGSSTWERCCLGLPTIQIVIAENQNTIYNSLVRSNAIKILQELKDLPNMFSDVSDWMEEISETSRKISDGLGVPRVFRALMESRS